MQEITWECTLFSSFKMPKLRAQTGSRSNKLSVDISEKDSNYDMIYHNDIVYNDYFISQTVVYTTCAT